MSGAMFQELYGKAPTYEVSAPGRVNLIGDHTDYADGFCLPMPLTQKVTLYASESPHGGKVASMSLGGPVAFTVDQAPTGRWIDYVVGPLQIAKQAGASVPEMSLLVQSDVPAGAGVSSSAALEVAVLRLLSQMGVVTCSATELALMAQKAENEYCGVACGVLDQMASSVGVEGAALLLDCRDLSTRAIAVPPGYSFYVIESGVSRQLLDGAYNERRSAVEEASRLLDVEKLRDVTQVADLAGLSSPLILKRARHVVSENARVLEAVRALEQADMTTFGRLMFESHQSLKRDFENSTPEVDDLVEDLAGAGALGARMTGGGFGGCVVALFPEGEASWWERLKARHPRIDQVACLTGSG